MKWVSAKFALCGGVAFWAMACGVAWAQTHAFDVPSAAAVDAIPEFARQAGIQLVAPADQLQGVRTQAVKGSLDTKAALADLLRGTGLVVASNDGQTFMLKAAPKNVQAASGSEAASVEQVVVTGSRYQARSETDAKRNSITVIDTISEDQIGQLPDQNIAESLRRIPGVTTLYDEDEGRFVTVRGINPNLNHVTFDGLSVATTDGFAGGGREVNLEAITPRAVGGLEVYKSFTPDMDAGVIGGAINLVTRSAFSGPADQTILSLGTNYFTYGDVSGANSLGGAKTGRIGGQAGILVSRVFGAHNEFGLVFSADWESKQRDELKQIGGTKLYFDQSGKATTPLSPAWNGYSVPSEFDWYPYTDREVSYGGSVKLEYVPVENWSTSLFLYEYQKGESETKNTTRYLSLSGITNQTPDSGSLSVGSSRIGWNYNTLNRSNAGAILASKFDFGAMEHLTAKVGWSFNSFHDYEPLIEYTWTPPASNKLTYNTDDYITTYQLTDPGAYINPANYTLGTLRQRYRNADENLIDARIDYSNNYDAGARGFGYSFGTEYRVQNRKVNFDLTNYNTDKSLLSEAAISPNYNPTGHNGPIVWINPNYVFSTIAPRVGINQAASASNSIISDYIYDEGVAAGYAALSWTGERWRVAGGLRYDSTDFLARNPKAVGGVAQSVFVSQNGSYDHLLPSVTGLYNVADDLRLKASFSQTLGRPNPADIAQLQVRDDVNRTITQGNPNLKPRQADNYDVSLEYFLPDNLGLVSVAAFDKEIRNDIFPFSNQQLVDGVTYTVTQPRNAEQSTLRGIEAGLVVDRLGFISPYLNNFGVRANATYADGVMHYILGGNRYTLGQLVQQSKWSGDAGIFYNWGPGEVRLDANYQGSYLDEFGAQPWQNLGWKGFVTVDLTGNYNLTDALQLRAEARNLTGANRHHVTGLGLHDFFEEIQFGQSFFLSANYAL